MAKPYSESGFTARAFLIGLALVMVWLLYDCTLVVDEALGAIEMLYTMGFGAVFTVFVVGFFNRQLPKRTRLSRAELTVIYAMVAVAIPWGLLIRGALEAPLKYILLQSPPSHPTIDFMPSLWCTKNPDAIQMFARGGYMPWEIRWREWMKPIVYWGAMLLSFQLFAIFLVLFFRRIFIDREQLPFPLAAVGRNVIECEDVKPEDENARKFRLTVKIAFLIGLLICLPGILSVTPVSWSPIPMNSAYYGTRTGIIKGLSVVLSWDAFVLCFLMFFPLHVLFTVAVVYVGFNIVLPTVWLWLGIPDPGLTAFVSGGFGMGGLLALAVWPVFFNRSLVLDGLKRAFRGGRSPDSRDPFSLRVIMLGMVLSFGAFVYLFIVGIGDVSQSPVRYLLAVVICVFVIVALLMAKIRANAEQGWHYHGFWWLGTTVSRAYVYWLSGPTALWRTQASFLSVSHVLHFGGYHNAFAPHLHLFDALRIASQNGTSTRGLMKAVFLTVLIALVVVIPGYVMLIHYYGFYHGPTTDAWMNFYNYQQAQAIVAYSAIPRSEFNWPSLAFGFLVVGLVMYLRREHAKFPLSAVGLVMCGISTSWFPNYSTDVIWLPIIIVLVVKYVIYRWFGVKFFRTRAIPVVTCLMMGLMTGMFIYKLFFAVTGKGFLKPY